MRKKRTSQRFWRGLRQGLALFVAAAALWLVWLTGDPAAALSQLSTLADNAQLGTALLAAELGMEPEGSGLSRWDRLVLSQSSLLGCALTPPSAVPAPEGSLPPAPIVSDAGEVPLPLTTTAPDNIIPRTMVAGSSSKYVTSGNVSIYNHTDYNLDVDALIAAAPQISLTGEGPQVLIYHSHATEAYTMDGTDIYEVSDAYRTLDTDYNIVRVGEEIASILEAAGIEVIHDTTLYDYPNYNDAYTRSYEGLANWLEQYPSIQLVMDVHRDALEAADGTIYKVVAGSVEHCAQVMMVMGSDSMGYSHPNWRVNLALAVEIQSALADKWSTLARPIVLRGSRFNQQLSTGALLVEIGTHGNTLQEALTAARLFARTLVELGSRQAAGTVVAPQAQ